MLSKKLMFAPVIPLLVAAAVVAGASQTGSIRIPAGAVVDSPNAQVPSNVTNKPAPAAPARVPAAGKLIYGNDFSSGKLDGLTELTSAPGFWTVTSKGVLVQNGKGSPGDLLDEAVVLVAKDITFADGSVEADVYPTGSPVGLVFRASESGYYRVALEERNEGNNAKLNLQKVSTKGVQDVATAPVSSYAGYERLKWLSLAVQANGATYTVSVNGTKLLTASDATYKVGTAGLWTFADGRTRFDNFRIQQPLAGK